MENINLANLSSEQLKDLQRQVKEREIAEKAQRDSEIATYKEMVSSTVISCFPTLQQLSEVLVITKREVRQSFRAILDMKAELYGVKETQQSHTFTSTDGKYRLTIGYNVIDNYDDTADAGVAMVKEYLEALGDTASGKQAVKISLSLLAKDTKGTLKASKIMTLRKHALDSGDPKFIEGVDIIMYAYKPIETKQYIRAEYKNDDGAWVNVPLGMTEAE